MVSAFTIQPVGGTYSDGDTITIEAYVSNRYEYEGLAVGFGSLLKWLKFSNVLLTQFATKRNETDYFSFGRPTPFSNYPSLQVTKISSVSSDTDWISAQVDKILTEGDVKQDTVPTVDTTQQVIYLVQPRVQPRVSKQLHFYIDRYITTYIIVTMTTLHDGCRLTPLSQYNVKITWSIQAKYSDSGNYKIVVNYGIYGSITSSPITISVVGGLTIL